MSYGPTPLVNALNVARWGSAGSAITGTPAGARNIPTFPAGPVSPNQESENQ